MTFVQGRFAFAAFFAMAVAGCSGEDVARDPADVAHVGGGPNGAGSRGGDGGPSADGGTGTPANDDGSGPASNADAPPAPARGASVPYWEYEAETATTNGVVLASSRKFGDIAAEASGRRAVRLDSTGQKIEFKTAHRTNSIVVRYSISDSPAGGGAAATLGLYVNGARRDLHLTSRYAWTYGDADAQNIGSESPSNGAPHHFFDEVHALFDDVPAGATIALQRDAQDSAAFYVIDLVDFEQVAPPLAQPGGSLSVTDFGATPDDGTDDSAAIQRAIDAAKGQGKIVWIPKGVFEAASKPAQRPWPKLVTSGVTIRGAGMWHSVIHGFGAQLAVSGKDNQFYDFALFGDVTYRDDNQGWHGFDGPAGTGSRMENVWIEHQTAGWWVGKGAFGGPVTQPLTDGLVVRGARIRNTYADGINFANATSNSIVEQSTFRNNGDDAIATWSYAADGPAPCANNVFRFNTVQTVWRANCFAIYGGKDHKIQDSVCADTSNYPGLLVSTTFNAMPFSGATSLERTTLTRAGGPHYNQEFGALRFFADTATITNVHATDIVIESPTFSGIHFGGAQQSTGIVLDGIAVKDYGTLGIWITSESRGNAQFGNVSVAGGANKGLQNDAPNSFSIVKAPGNTGL
jgi:hypothetical protein